MPARPYEFRDLLQGVISQRELESFYAEREEPLPPFTPGACSVCGMPEENEECQNPVCELGGQFGLSVSPRRAWEHRE